MRIVSICEPMMYLLILWMVVKTLRSSDRIRAVKVMVTILTKLC
jgi:hypothetical protein